MGIVGGSLEPEAEEQTQAGEKRYVIHFISDFHARMSGVKLGNGSCVGGLTQLVERVRKRRKELQNGGNLEEKAPPDEMFLCLGGDMLRNVTHRLVHRGTAGDVWDHMLDELQADAWVLGNHEVEDFGAPVLERIALATARPCEGCTRNVEWDTSAGTTPGGVACSGHGAGHVPASSGHVKIGKDAPALRFVGMVHRRNDMQFGKLHIRASDDVMRTFLLDHCLNGTCSHGEAALHIHLAHYDGKVEPDRIDRTDYSRCEPGFGAEWHAFATGNDSKGPHFILKGHDHGLSEDVSNGRVDTLDRKEEIFFPCENSLDWIPTFRAGSDGKYIGELELVIGEDHVRYDWRTLPVGRSSGMWRPPDSWPRLASKSPSRCIRDVEYAPFGGSAVHAEELYRSVCLMLGAMRHRAPSIAIVPPCSIRSSCGVPNEPPYELSRAEEEQWRTSIDDWDLQHVFGKKPSVATYPFEAAALAERLGDAACHGKLAESILPPLAAGDPEERETLKSPDGGPGALLPMACSLCLRHGDNTYLIARSGDGGGAVNSYLLVNAGAHAFARQYLGEGVGPFLQHAGLPEASVVEVSTYEYFADAFGWHEYRTDRLGRAHELAFNYINERILESGTGICASLFGA